MCLQRHADVCPAVIKGLTSRVVFVLKASGFGTKTVNGPRPCTEIAIIWKQSSVNAIPPAGDDRGEHYSPSDQSKSPCIDSSLFPATRQQLVQSPVGPLSSCFSCSPSPQCLCRSHRRRCNLPCRCSFERLDLSCCTGHTNHSRRFSGTSASTHEHKSKKPLTETGAAWNPRTVCATLNLSFSDQKRKHISLRQLSGLFLLSLVFDRTADRWGVVWGGMLLFCSIPGSPAQQGEPYQSQSTDWKHDYPSSCAKAGEDIILLGTLNRAA